MNLGGFGSDAKNQIFDKLMEQLDTYASQLREKGQDAGEAVGEGFEEGVRTSVPKIKKSKEQLLKELGSLQHDFEEKLKRLPLIMRDSLQQFDFRSIASVSANLSRTVQKIKRIYNELYETGDAPDIAAWVDSMSEKASELGVAFGALQGPLDGVTDSMQKNANAATSASEAQDELSSSMDKTSKSAKKQKSALQAAMKATATLIGSLQGKYGAEKFNQIFGDTISAFGALDVSNAVAMYDALLAKENEYFTSVQQHMKDGASFTQNSAAMLAQYQGVDKFAQKYSNLLAQILNGEITLENASTQLTEFAGTISNTFGQEATSNVERFTDALQRNSEAVSQYVSSYSSADMSRLTRGTNIQSLLGQFNVPKEDKNTIVGVFNQWASMIADSRRLANSGFENEELVSQINETMSLIVDSIMQSGSMKMPVEKMFQEFYSHMKGIQIGYTETDVADFGDAWSDIIKRFGSGAHKVLTKDPSAMKVDQLWGELVELFPQFFDAATINQQDQLRRVLEVLQQARDERNNKAKTQSMALPESAISDIAASLSENMHIVEQNADLMISGARAAVEGQQEIAAAAASAASAIERQGSAAQKTSGAINDMAESMKASAQDLIEKDIAQALAQLRNAANNETTLISLKGVFSGDDLVDQLRLMAENIADQANLSVGKINVKDSIARVQLYNKELQVTVDQLYQLKSAEEDVGAVNLELVSQSFSQNVKALNENTFDVDGIRARATSAIEKVRASLHGLSYDLTDLETAAKSISSQEDFNRFNNQLKAAQDNIQAIKNSTVSKSSMNPLANMQRDMQNANIEVETLRLKLEKFGDIQGVAEARRMIEEMAAAAQQYNQAQDSSGQQSAYNQYSNTRSSFNAQMDYIKAAKQFNESQETSSKKVDPIREQYQSLLDIINKINSVSSQITDYQKKDGGSGIFSHYITMLQSEKTQLLSQLQSTGQEINNVLGGIFTQGTEYSVPFSNLTAGDSTIASFLNDTRVQASLTNEEIEKLIVALQRAQSVDANAAARVAEQFKTTAQLTQQISSMENVNKGNSGYQNFVMANNALMNYKNQLSSDSTTWSPEESARLQSYIDLVNQLGKAFLSAAQQQQQYIGKMQHQLTPDQDIGEVVRSSETAIQAASEASSQETLLRQKAQETAESLGASAPIFTQFVQDANGLASLDFSVLDNATGSMREFTVACGDAINSMGLDEKIKNSFDATMQAAKKQAESVQTLLSKLSASNIKTGDGASPIVQNLQSAYDALLGVSAQGSGASQKDVMQAMQNVENEMKITEKAYQQTLKLRSAIDDGSMREIGTAIPGGDKYQQMAQHVQAFADGQSGATLQLGRFNERAGTLDFTLTQANGTMKSFRASMESLGGQVGVQQTGVKQLTSQWDRFKTGVMKAGKQLMTALVGYNMFYKAISMVRQGVNYVKEIDLAMTELKKVTDETTESYNKFLSAAAENASAVGSTVSEYTEATANFARLGYSMEESADMAKTALVYKNVADGLDTVDAATDSIISTMKANLNAFCVQKCA